MAGIQMAYKGSHVKMPATSWYTHLMITFVSKLVICGMHGFSEHAN